MASNAKIAILWAFIPGFIGFLGLGYFYYRRFGLGLMYLSLGFAFLLNLYLFHSNEKYYHDWLFIIVFGIIYIGIWIWQTYNTQSIVADYTIIKDIKSIQNNLSKKIDENKISIEVEFPKITYYNLVLNLIEKVALSRIASLYEYLSRYSLPIITALALYILISSIIVLYTNEIVREGARGISIPWDTPFSFTTINYLTGMFGGQLGPWETPISAGAIAYLSSIFASQLGQCIIAKRYNIKIESWGCNTIIGIIPTNFFLNIDKEEITKLPLIIKSAIFAVNPLSNMILSLISLGILFLIVSSLTPISQDKSDIYGVAVTSVSENSLAESLGLKAYQSIIQQIQNNEIKTPSDLNNNLDSNLGKTVSITWLNDDGEKVVKQASLPKERRVGEGILGVTITEIRDPKEVLDKYKFLFVSNPLSLLAPPTLAQGSIPFSVLMQDKYTSLIWIPNFAEVATFFYWIWFVNFNIGLLGSLPISHLPGGRLYNAFIGYRLRNKPRWMVKVLTIVISVAMIVVVFLPSYIPWVIT